MADLVLYSNPMSRGRIVRWMLEEVGRPYDVEMVDLAAPKTPAIVAMNPMGKVPILRHGAMIVTETAAICAYLADAFPEARLAPALGDRAAYYRWLFFAAGPVEHAATNHALKVDVPPKRRGMTGYGSMADVLDTLETSLDGRPYVAGERFTAADVVLGSQVGWGMMFGTIERRPAFERYWQGLSARPAAARAREIDDALLPPERRMGGR